MSDYSFVAERAKKAWSNVAKLETALERRPEDRNLQVNLTSMRRLAERAREDLYRLAEVNHIEVCNYRLLPAATESYALEHVANSFLQYQFLFSQIYDAKKNGPKSKAGVGRDSAVESALDFAYSYSGSLGVVLLARSERTYFDGTLDAPIEALYQVLEVADTDDVRDVAKVLGTAVVKRAHDWSAANVNGGFSVDVRWKRSDGRELGQVIDRGQMERIVGIIGEASEETPETLQVRGTLVGIDVTARTFHFVVPQGEDFKGRLSEDFAGSGTVVPREYVARIISLQKFHYATERLDTKYTLQHLEPISA